MKNQVIEVLNVEHGKKAIEYWKSRGINTKDFTGQCTKEINAVYRYYGVINGIFNIYSLKYVNEHNAEIITLPEKTFPRKMLVWDNNECNSVERIVLWINTFGNPEFPSVIAVQECKEKQFKDGLEYSTTTWKHAKELPEVKELTIEEAAKKLSEVFGMEVKIKDERIA